jgi:hypothetical protein
MLTFQNHSLKSDIARQNKIAVLVTNSLQNFKKVKVKQRELKYGKIT